ncbi:uncharacterized protein DUF4105 [Ulvibacter sp. MAR_2010_11]|uniref:lipoprotein N-acyltransferase Lnb domain-containing protein n=1 Tax=Ulvibacter sp. MAR_2010_11 TaxID=1250229 RepID=UPI000CB8402C|nr:DUF4105 domain-containing protein [Ulvibacter sp. MAR_2010_11]PKA82102.1 uncharacterized protein DUF4105 [Ulvibacter sp. MAR_2010_11]
MKKILLLFSLFLLFVSIELKAQYIPISEEAEVSILTIGPGAQLYDKFGHSAYRVKDETTGLDLVFNYGVYDFDTPNFYTKFAQGKLLYKLDVSLYEPFFETYKAQNRWIKEQELNLTYYQKKNVFEFLQNNAKPENKFYKYDFFFDNCATKIRDVLVSVLGADLKYNDASVPEDYTFRELIQKNVYWNSWGSLGMDVAIGAVVDKKATAWEYQFLPDYVFEEAATATLQQRGGKTPLVKKSQTLFQNSPTKEEQNFFASPLFFFGLLGVFIIIATFRDYKNKFRSRYLDVSISLITGLIGVFLLLLWVATDHTATANNYNLLWAFPLNIILAFFAVKRQPPMWVQRYVFLLLVLLVLMTIHWITGVQVFAKAFTPMFLALGVRYIYVIYYLKRQALPIDPDKK